MQHLDEIFDVVDDYDRVVGQASRAEVHASQLRHRAVHVLLFNTNDELLVQKRAATKDSFPGCFDSSASGHLVSGEDYNACARRELHEELGLLLPAESFRKHFKLEAGPDTGWEFVWVYSVHGAHSVTPNPLEVESITAFSRVQLQELIARQPEACARSFCRIGKELFARGLFPPSP